MFPGYAPVCSFTITEWAIAILIFYDDHMVHAMHILQFFKCFICAHLKTTNTSILGHMHSGIPVWKMDFICNLDGEMCKYRSTLACVRSTLRRSVPVNLFSSDNDVGDKYTIDDIFQFWTDFCIVKALYKCHNYLRIIIGIYV